MAGVCPICLQDRGIPPRRENGAWRAPSTELKICGSSEPSGRGRRAWRLSTFGPDPITHVSPNFDPNSVERVYHLCGEGHVWLVDRPFRGASGPTVTEPDQIVVFAMLGEVAAGKSYLLSRALKQQLLIKRLRDLPGADGALDFRARPADAWEDHVGSALSQAYNRTRSGGVRMLPTELDALLPAVLLSSDGRSAELEFEPGRDLVDVLREIHGQLPDGGHQTDQRFGRKIRQPVVVRARFTDPSRSVNHTRSTLTGIADLAGESFKLLRPEDEDQQRLLQGFDGLIWVLDPAVEERVAALVREAARMNPGLMPDGDEVMFASTRAEAGLAALDDPYLLGDHRRVADQINDDNGPIGRQGPRRPVYVVISKCDVINAALTVGGFDRLGELPDAVEDGVTQYIRYVLHRSEQESLEHGEMAICPRLDAVLRSVRNADTVGLRRDVATLARGLVKHYGRQAHFWRLVHGPDRTGTTVELRPEPGSPGRRLPNLEVPSLQSHLIDSLQPNQAEYLRVRDFVMSALGCGIAYALGYETDVDRLMNDKDCEVRFYLCSPLVELPTQPTGAATGSIRAANNSFPRIDAESAGLTQLLLGILRVGLP